MRIIENLKSLIEEANLEPSEHNFAELGERCMKELPKLFALVEAAQHISVHETTAAAEKLADDFYEALAALEDRQ